MYIGRIVMDMAHISDKNYILKVFSIESKSKLIKLVEKTYSLYMNWLPIQHKAFQLFYFLYLP